MDERATDEDLALLGELGVEVEAAPAGGRTPREQRIVAGFEEIERFVADHGRTPQHGEGRDIFERLYAVRLDRMRESAECRAALAGLDPRGLLDVGTAEETGGETDEELLAALGIGAAPEEDITRLTHVRPTAERKSPDEVAQRRPCEDFEASRPVFERAQRELESGGRRTVPFKGRDNQAIDVGDWFILDGQKAYVASGDVPFIADYGERDRRLRVVFDNGTESDLLMRSLRRALNKDERSRRILETAPGPLFAEIEEEGDLSTGYVYVLRSDSDDAFVAANRELVHKIGVTGGDVKRRVAGARKDPTYLLADVEIVATYKLANVNRRALEALLHKFFAAARLDVTLEDRFGAGVEPREWFLVPLPAVDAAMEKLRAGTLGDFHYDPEQARLVPV